MVKHAECCRKTRRLFWGIHYPSFVFRHYLFASMIGKGMSLVREEFSRGFMLSVMYANFRCRLFLATSMNCGGRKSKNLGSVPCKSVASSKSRVSVELCVSSSE